MCLAGTYRQKRPISAAIAAPISRSVAELEATTARRGNRKVGLTVSGWVNEQVLYWNDGTENNVYVGNNDMERSRFRFVGETKIDKDWFGGLRDRVRHP